MEEQPHGLSDVGLVYYIGAGASAKSLPTVENTHGSIRSLVNIIKPDDLPRHLRQNLDDAKQQKLAVLTQMMQELADRVAEGPSIDLLARRHYLRRETDLLHRLKAMLSAFLMLEQDQKSVDPRYDYFFAYMADWDEHGTLAMPANVRVISWNYDGQFEKSFAAFFEQDNQKREVVDALQIVPPVTCDQYDSGISSIYKLNGTAHIQADGSDKPGQYHDVLVHDQPDLLNAILLTLHAFDACLSGSATPSIRFAWENDPRRRDVLALIEEFAPVETLVVIGYSFPLFNRDIDRRVLELLSPKEIYLQVAKQYPAVADRIRGIGPTVDIHEVKDEDQFFIPPSYSLSERRAPRNLEL